MSLFARTCQSCGHIQQDKEPEGSPTDAYQNRKCRRCGSMDLDYGHKGFALKPDGKSLVRVRDDEAEEN